MNIIKGDHFAAPIKEEDGDHLQGSSQCTKFNTVNFMRKMPKFR